MISTGDVCIFSYDKSTFVAPVVNWSGNTVYVSRGVKCPKENILTDPPEIPDMNNKQYSS